LKSYPNDSQLFQFSEEILHQLPTTFVETVTKVKIFALQEFDREIATKQLYYHTRDHIKRVQCRSSELFQAIYPSWKASLEPATPDYFTRMYVLLDLCAVAHDMVQIFLPQTQPHTSRRRETGVSETLTIQKLLDYIQLLNQQLHEYRVDNSARLTDEELSILQEAISATICAYDPVEQAIYQPSLYNSRKPLSPVTIILALADIGSLGMEGIDSYNQEGSFIFLEENCDVIPILANIEIKTLASKNLELYENIRQRLLKRASFQVNFAKSRLNRYVDEIKNLPEEGRLVLNQNLFQYLNTTTIQEIELTTPTDINTPLEVLVEFFKLNELIELVVQEKFSKDVVI
jgi:hypothetical protein